MMIHQRIPHNSTPLQEQCRMSNKPKILLIELTRTVNKLYVKTLKCKIIVNFMQQGAGKLL